MTQPQPAIDPANFEADIERLIVADYAAGVPLKILRPRYLVGSDELYEILRRNGIPLRAVTVGLGRKPGDPNILPVEQDEAPEPRRIARQIKEDDAFQAALAAAHPKLPKGPSLIPCTERPHKAPCHVLVNSADRWLWPADCGV
jgi:hypothetical protein